MKSLQMVQLIFEIDGEERTLDVPEGSSSLGRQDDLDLIIPHKSVSKSHARLVRTGEEVSIEDLGSKNGTWVNDVPCEGILTVKVVQCQQYRGLPITGTRWVGD